MGKISQYNDVPVPKLSDMLIGTSVGLNEQDQVENQTYNFTLQQLLDLFVPNIPSNSLQGVLDNGNTATQDINLFGKITTTDLEVTNDANFNNSYLLGNTYIQGLLFDETYESGVDGQVLSRSATGVKWVTLPPIFTPNLQQVLNVGNIASTDIQLSATLFADAVESDEIISNTSLTVSGELVDGDGFSGLNNQVLTSTGAGKVEWKDQITYSGVAPISVDNGTKQISISQAGSTSDGYLSSTDWNVFDSKQDGLFGTGIVKSTAGVITYITDNSADWNSAYNDTIVSAGVAGTTTKTLTLTQRDGGTITASWSDIDTAPVTSVFGRTGDVVAQTGDYTTTQVTEGTNLYYLDSRARAAISLTTTGSSGPATYNSSTGVLNIPDYGGVLTGYVPYTGATSNVNLGERGITSGYVAFDLTPTGTPTGVSTMYWDTAYRTVSLIDGDGDTTLQIGQEERVLVHNNTGSALTDGQVVYITGSTGNLPSVALASAASESNSAVTIGVVTESIAHGSDGFVTVSGIVNGLNTLAFTEGDMLWLGVTPGTFTNVKPISPNHLVLIGYVVKRAGGNGSILVKIQNTQELNECSDVLFDIPEVDGQVLSLQTVSGTQLWRNRTIPAILGYTPISLASLSASSPLSYNNTTGAFSIQQANGSQNGFLSSTDWNTFNSKVSSQWITLGNDIYYSLGSVLVGTSTAVGQEKFLIQFDSNTATPEGLNILDSYSSATDSLFLTFRKSTGTAVGNIRRNGTSDGLYVGGGLNLGLGVANTERISINNSGNVGINKTNPTVALDVVGQIRSTTGFLGNASTATALASPRTFTIGNTGKSFDGTANVSWTLGEIGAQAAGNYITSLTGEATATGPGAASVTLTNSAVTGKVLTGVNITGGSINDTDSILTAFGKVQNQINGLVGGSIYQGTWNASTNTPSLASGVGTKGYYYIVSVAGSTNLDGITDWNVGDWAIFDGTAWQQVDNTDAVVSVNGFTGAVSLTTANIPEASNLYYTDARARAALSFTAGSGAYNSTTGVITIPTNTNQLTNGANFITLASLSASSPLSYNNGTGAFSITQANSTTNGFLSSTDWNTFNNKQNALTNPITGTGTTNTLPKFTGSTTLGNSNITDSGTQITLNSATTVNGFLGIGTTTPNISNVRISTNLTGGTAFRSLLVDGSVQSDVTSEANYFQTSVSTQAASFTISNLRHYQASQGTIGAGSAITVQSGFEVRSSLIGAVNNYGFRGSIPSGTNRFNLYMDGTANNYLAGNLGIGVINATVPLDVVGQQNFRGITATDGPTLGSELLSSTGWTSTDWTGDFSTGFTHTTGNTSVLSNTLAAVVNNAYLIVLTVTGRTTGSFTTTFGGQTSQAITSTTNYGVFATTTGNLQITPTSDFNGTIVVSLRQVTTVQSALTTWRNSSNTIVSELRFPSDNTSIYLGLNSGRNTTQANANNVAIGQGTLQRNVSGFSNVAIGQGTMANNVSGIWNTAVGGSSLQSNVTGNQNSVYGRQAGALNTSGNDNGFFGYQSGFNNTTGSRNNGFGTSSLISNTTGTDNTAFGHRALVNNTTGSNNVAIGSGALSSSTTPNQNTAVGTNAGAANTTGSVNTFIGVTAGNNNTTGSNNTFVGNLAAANNTTGSNTIAIGTQAGRFIANGTTAATILTNSVFLGVSSRPNADNQTNQIAIGFDAVGLGSNTTVIGNTSTVTSAIYGRLLLGTTTDNGSDRLQVTGNGLFTGTLEIDTVNNGVGDFLTRTAGGIITRRTASEVRTDIGAISLTSLSATSPLSYNNSTGVFSISQSNSTTNGFLSSTDWTTFNNKIGGSGTTDFIPKFSSSNSITPSRIIDDGSSVSIGTYRNTYDLSVTGNSSNGSLAVFNPTNRGNIVLSIRSNLNAISSRLDSSLTTPRDFAIEGNNLIFYSGGTSESMRITSGGYVGIGTSIPNSRLEIREFNRDFNGYGNVNIFTTDPPLFQGAGGSIAFGGENGSVTTPYPFAKIQGYKENALEGDPSGGLWLGTTSPSGNLIQRMTITSLGFVGINQTNPQSIFHVLTGPNKNINFVDAGHSTLTNLGSAITFSRQDGLLATSAIFSVNSGGLGLAGRTGIIFAVGGTSNYSATTEAMRITNIGNLWIGGTNMGSNAKLGVSNAGVEAIEFAPAVSANTTRMLSYNRSTLNWIASQLVASEFQFQISGIERMRLTSVGNLGIGTSVTNGRLHVTSFNGTVSVIEDASNISDITLVSFVANTNNIGSITRVGTTNAVAYNVTSDYRLKEDLQEIKGIEQLSKIKVYDFKWKDNEFRMDGVLAHELQEVVPYAVTGKKDGEEMQSVDYSKLVPILIKAVQEQQKQIEELKKLIK